MINLLNSPSEFIFHFRMRMKNALPGAQAQDKMSSRARLSLSDYLEQRPDHRKSAVMMMLYPVDSVIHTLIIERPSYEGVHSGQLALPGGKIEPADVALVNTAMRETLEEVGVVLTKENIVGPLTPLYIPPSNFLVSPFVAWLNERPVFYPDQHEVNGILEIPLHTFLDPGIKGRKRISVGDKLFVEAPCYMLGDYVLWGATAMMFSELEEILEGK